MQNTAQYREMARVAESRLAWEAAAFLYERAVQVYPSTGSLAELDKQKLAAKALSCARMAKTNG